MTKDKALLEKHAKRRKQFMTKPTGPSMTKTEFALDSDINVIMHRFIKTGVPPQSHIDPNSLQYMDVSQFGTFQENYEKVLAAKQHFAQYPAEIREAMQNDPAKMQKFFADPDNYDLLKKHKLLKNEVELQKIDPIVKELRSLKSELTKPSKKPTE